MSMGILAAGTNKFFTTKLITTLGNTRALGRIVQDRRQMFGLAPGNRVVY